MNDSALTPLTKSARLQLVIELLQHEEVRSQVELADLLAERGVQVTQATLSRDLVELDAVKVRGGSGGLVYAVPGRAGTGRRPPSGRPLARKHGSPACAPSFS
ncbi:hypothetical protein [Nocardioides alcanivorans]|uniref:hypothetical protein n=1 Tax=Nocardioides alcanivorans TaxID=2897352 RepID=UPI0035D7DF19